MWQLASDKRSAILYEKLAKENNLA